jgi:hypothetical protein
MYKQANALIIDHLRYYVILKSRFVVQRNSLSVRERTIKIVFYKERQLYLFRIKLKKISKETFETQYIKDFFQTHVSVTHIYVYGI